MVKGSLEKIISLNTGVDAETTKAILDALSLLIVEKCNECEEGPALKVSGIGVFVVSKRSARQGRKPKTGEIIQIPEKRVPGIRFTKGLKDAAASASVSPDPG